jgi:hypothetical protein
MAALKTPSAIVFGSGIAAMVAELVATALEAPVAN